MTKTITLIALLLSISLPVLGHSKASEKSGLFQGEASPAGKIVLMFHEALKTGNKELVKELLAKDVLVYEGGRVERSAAEYAEHHMLADMEFSAALNSKLLEHQVTVSGDTAISVSRKHTTGTYKGKTRDFEGMETIVLEKQKGHWKIKHIHWSS